MKRLLETTLTRLLLLGLVALGVMQVWQLNRIEGRLVAIEADGAAGAQRADPRAPSQAASADAMIDCTKSDWWASDQQATAEPGNALAMHTRCKVQAEHVESGGTFRRVWAADLGGLNPYGDAGNNADVREIFQYVSAALAYRHPEQPSVWSPDLAQSASWSPDGRVLTVRLRQGVLWHPPQVDLDDPRHAWLRGDHELTADDYLFVFNHVLDPAPVGAAPERLTTTHTDLNRHLRDTTGKLRRFVNVYLNDEDIRFLPEKETTALRAGDSMIIVPSIAGGRS